MYINGCTYDIVIFMFELRNQQLLYKNVIQSFCEFLYIEQLNNVMYMFYFLCVIILTHVSISSNATKQDDRI